MLFYATALGFALCYIRYATGSIFVTTVLHAIVNSLAAGMLVVLTLSDMYNQGNKLINTIYSIYILAILILIIIGIFAFFKKIPVIRKYKIDNPWTEIGAGKKTALFLLSVPVLIMLVFAFNEHANNLLLNLIIN
jgi:membrane protease YdiL (CAAX protease family)